MMRIRLILLLLIATCLVGCATQTGYYSTHASHTRHHYYPTHYKQRGTASWYGAHFHRKRTSTGARYNMYALTAAHRSFPMGSKVRVTNLNNHRTVIVRINDRGPFFFARIIDVSYGAARALGMLHSGTARVEIELLSQ